MNVGVWLRELGLAQYEAAFRDNDVDEAVLPKLTVDDLKDLGVVSVGHRRKILLAIEALNAPSALPADAADRRQLTVVFCDLVGSTALSARLDPEDMRQVIHAYQDACSGVLARYDGFVAKFFGDGILAYFGFPRAHEDDAARAVHAALDIAEAMPSLQTRAREKLSVRVGIATGIVVAGDIVGQGSSQEHVVVGDTPNLAARLQGLAEAGGIVVSAATRRLLGDRFRLKDLGRHVVKGLAEPVEAFAALGLSQSESRFDAAHTSRLTGFVGRAAESAELLARQRRAWAGHGQIVLISGEAGIGKSRLCAWLADEVVETPHARLRYQCSPYHRDSALYPFAQQFERAAGIAAQEPPEVKLDKLERVLSPATHRLNEVAPLIASMLSIPFGARYPALTLSPDQQRHLTLSALRDQMEGLAKTQPLLILFEDAHWADATSLEVLDLLLESIARLRALLLITFRPEFEAPWLALPGVATVALGRLDRVQAETLVTRVTGGRELPAEVLAQIVAKTDGVPLFVEELTKNVLESGLLVEGLDRYRLDGPLPPLAIPSTLQDSSMARLDRLAGVKDIAQIGAAIGREFSYPLLRAVVGRDEPTLRAALAQLEESELVFRSGEPPAARYAFKHALIQDTAYESLLKSRRQVLHQKIAETLREHFADIVEAEPELLAHHFTQAGLAETAIEYWGRAGELALYRSAFKEAIAHLGKAIEMAEWTGARARSAMGDSAAPSQRLTQLHLAYGNALIAARGHGALETTAAFARARELSSGAENPAEQFSIYYGLWAGSFVRGGELTAMREVSSAAVELAERYPGTGEAAMAHRMRGMTNWYQGDYANAQVHLERALAMFDPDRDCDLAFRFGQDIGVSFMNYLALALWPIGEIRRAQELESAALARAQETGHVATLAYAASYRSIFEMMRLDARAAEPYAAQTLELGRLHGLSLSAGYASVVSAWAQAQLGDRAQGIAQMRQGLDNLRRQGFTLITPLFDAFLADLEAERGEIDAALGVLDRTFADIGRTEHRTFDAEIHRVRGKTMLKRNPANTSPAEEAFLTAIAVAREQGARSFGLRAALSLAKLYQSAARVTEAHAVLAPALEGFASTAEMTEIAEAQALLAG